MKAKWFSRIFAAVMVIVMLMGSCLSVSAVSVSAPETTPSDDNYYSVVYEDGTLTVRVNPEKIYGILKDGALTRDELINFIPEDVLETFSQGKNVGIDDLRELVANYITIDDLKEIVNELPIDIIKEYFSVNMLLDIFELNEILALFPIDEMFASIDEEAIKSLLTEDVVALLFTEEIEKLLIDNGYVTSLVENSTIVDDLMADPATKAEIIKFVDAEFIASLMSDPVVEAKLMALASSKTVVDRILSNPELLEMIENYMVSSENAVAFQNFIDDPVVDEALMDMQAVKQFLLSTEVIHILVEEHVLDKDVIADVFGDDIDTLVTDSVVDYLLTNSAFINGIFSDNTLLDKILTDELVGTLADSGVFSSLITPEEVLGLPNFDIPGALVALGITDEMVFDACVDSADHLEIYDKYGEDVTAQELLDGGYVQTADIIDTFHITAQILIANDVVAPADIRALVSDDEIKTLVTTNTYVRITVSNSLKTNNNVSTDDYWSYIDFEDMIAHIGENEVKNIFENNPDIYANMFEVVHPHDIFNAIGIERCRKVVLDHADELIEDVGMDKIFEHYDRDALIEAIGGYSMLLEKELVSVDEVADTLGGYGVLFDYFDVQEIIDAIGIETLIPYVNIPELIDSLGGYANVLKLYSQSELKGIFNAMDKATLKAFVKDQLLVSVDVKAIANDVIDYAKAKLPDVKRFVKSVLKQSANFFLTEVDSITVNGTDVYDLGLFDLNLILGEVLRALPDFETFMSFDADKIFSTFDISVVIRGVEYKACVELGFLGDPTTLQNYFAERADMFKLDITDGNIVDVDISTPDVVSDIYRRILESEKIPAKLRDKLVILPTTSVDEALELIADLPYEDVEIIASTIAEKVGPIRDKAYEKIDAMYAKLSPASEPTPAVFARRAVPQAPAVDEKIGEAIDKAKVKVDDILDKFTDPAKLDALIKDAVNKIDEKIPAELRDKEIFDLYNGNGNFTAGGVVTVDVYEALSKLVSLPEELKLFLKSTEVAIGFESDITVNGLYNAELVKNDGTTMNVLLPADFNMATLADFESFKDVGGLMLDDLSSVIKMPEQDVKLYSDGLYSVQFVADGTVLSTVIYPYGTDSVDAPIIPVEYEKVGYNVSWESFTLNDTQRLVVNLKYTPIQYKATFMADGRFVADKFFTIEDLEGGIIEPAVPAKPGYTGAWEDYTLGLSDIEINAVYTIINYKAVFKADGVQVGNPVYFTVNDLTSGITEPAVPSKTGYTGAWEDYTLTLSDIEINAVYTLINYKATFMADGEVVAEVPFTIEDLANGIDEPDVPEKEGYIGRWEEYTLGASDIVINAIYTLKPGGEDITTEPKGPEKTTKIPGGDTTTTDKGGDNTADSSKGTFWWWIILVIALLIIIAIIVYILLKPKDDDDEDPMPPAPPVVEPVEEEEVVELEEVDDIDQATADSLMSDDLALAAIVYKEGGSTEGFRAVVNLGDINEAFSDGDKVDIDTLKAKGLIPAKTRRVKILADGHLNKHGLEVEANSFSLQAIKMITLTGGTAVQKK